MILVLLEHTDNEYTIFKQVVYNPVLTGTFLCIRSFSLILENRIRYLQLFKLFFFCFQVIVFFLQIHKEETEMKIRISIQLCRIQHNYQLYSQEHLFICISFVN